MIEIMSGTISSFEDLLPRAAQSDRLLAAGDVLFRQDEPSFGFFRLLTGAMEMVRWTPTGTRLRLHAVKPGETFAEASLFSDTYHCDAIAMGEASVRCYSRQQVLLALEATPALAIQLSGHLAAALRDARRLAELRSVSPLKRRMLWRLKDLADEDGRIPAAVTVTGIAADIGATPEACYRAIADLQSEGFLTRPARGRIVLTPGQS